MISHFILQEKFSGDLSFFESKKTQFSTVWSNVYPCVFITFQVEKHQLFTSSLLSSISKHLRLPSSPRALHQPVYYLVWVVTGFFRRSGNSYGQKLAKKTFFENFTPVSLNSDSRITEDPFSNSLKYYKIPQDHMATFVKYFRRSKSFLYI